MKKIISLFQRNYEGDRLVRDEVVPGAEWVLAGDGIPTQKWDGTPILIKDGMPYKRYDAKKGRTPPANFMPAQPDPDPVSGHWPGWTPTIKGDGVYTWLEEALAAGGPLSDWTYELCGPKINGNPEGFCTHRLIRHGSVIHTLPSTSFNDIRNYLAIAHIEGIVWWRGLYELDCEKVKIKAKDFGIKRAAPS